MKNKITFFKISLIIKRVKKIVPILFFILLISSEALSQTIVDRYGRLKVTGSHVTAENGDKISFAGNSLFWSNAGDTADYYNAESVNHLADDWRSYIIRPALGVKENWDGGTGYIDNPQQQKAKIRKVIDAAIAKGIYVIIDWHTHAAEQYTAEATDFFREMAQLYGQYDNVIYEIYNEPLNSTSWDTVKNYANPVIAAIRSQDPDNLIIVGTPTWSQDVHIAAANPITGDPNLAYTMHFYANTHGQWLRDRTLQAMNSGIAIFVTEFGTTDASGNGGYNPGQSQVWLDFLISNNISYVNWTISDKNEDSCVVRPNMGLQGLLNGNLTDSGNFIRDHMRARGVVLSNDEFILDANTVKLYPNPVNNIVHIKTDTALKSVSIYDITGRLVLSNTIKENQEEIKINMESLATGNYVLKLQSSKNRVVTKKVFKL